jgi:hypothetical protein
MKYKITVTRYREQGSQRKPFTYTFIANYPNERFAYQQAIKVEGNQGYFCSIDKIEEIGDDN